MPNVKATERARVWDAMSDLCRCKDSLYCHHWEVLKTEHDGAGRPVGRCDLPYCPALTDNAVVTREWYHGSPQRFHRFTDELVGKGTDQEGPGIYFTSDEDDAAHYASGPTGSVYAVDLLTPFVLVPSSGPKPIAKLLRLASMADGYRDKMLDWGYERHADNVSAFKQALLREENPRQAFLLVWYNIYRYQPVAFVRNMAALGYDGAMVEKDGGRRHLVVYNVRSLYIVNVKGDDERC